MSEFWDPLRPLVYILIFAVLSFVIFKRWISDIYQTKRRRYKGHSWKSIQSYKAIPYDNVCTICGKLMMASVGQYCERCSLSACRGCRKKAERKQGCRTVSASPTEPFYHHWVKVGATCEQCNTLSDDSKNDFFCCWCQRTQHCTNAEPLKAICDFGSFRNQIIPPTVVQIGRGGSIKLTPCNRPDWQPIILIGNPKSGGGAGDEIMSLFRGFLNPLQIIKLSQKNLASLMTWLPSESRVIVAGGDGSVAAVLTAIADNKNLTTKPSVAVLPLGTGNDLSRVLGWGANTVIPFSPASFLNDVKCAASQQIDRWCIQIGRRIIYSYNYMSIGVDARVALDFHRARLHPLYVRGSQWMNYMIYLCLGTQQVLSQDCSDLEKLLEVSLDGEIITVPRLQALLLLNIPSWGAGVDVWNAGADPLVGAQSYNDGKLEILGINSSFHIAQLQVGLSQPNRIGQASEINIKLKGLAPMQVDGEPWEQTSCEISVRKVGTVSVLCRNS